jgi:beta-lactamase class A
MRRVRKFLAALALALPVMAATPTVHSRPPASAQDARDAYIQQQVAAIVAQGKGRIGVAAMDLDGGGQIYINADQPFPMASTAKIAVAATFLKGVEAGRFRFDQQFPMMVRVRENGVRARQAPLMAGNLLTAQTLIEMMITRSNNEATDGLLAVVGGPPAVNRWLSTIGISGQQLDHTMATLVRDDGAIDPAKVIDVRTSSTPRAMLALLAAIDKGSVLSEASRAVLLGSMTRTTTGSRRIRAGLPAGTIVAHKTGTLSGVTDDVGIIRMPDGRHLALVVFVTGPEGHRAHDGLISQITSVIYNGYLQPRSGPAVATAAR